MHETQGWIVFFNRIDRADYLISESELRAKIDLKPLRKQQPNDGKIFRLAE